MVGRDEEVIICHKILASTSAELLLVTGRRRVGKTYLIRQVFSESMVFEFTGTKEAPMDNQLEKFASQIESFFPSQGKCPKFDNWFQALKHLGQCYTKIRHRRKKVIFLDELPWIVSEKSNFILELEYWWNAWASLKNDLIIVVSGSSTAWMNKHIRDNKNGFHNRTTKNIYLEPFTLQECKAFFKKKAFPLDEYHISQLYLCFGGIPYYLEGVERGDSFAQTVNKMCFNKNGLLYNEFNNLYHALFRQPNNYIAVVRALATKWKGLTRPEIIQLTNIPNGGGMTTILESLEQCSFIMKTTPLDKKSKDSLYRLVDEFSIFYFTFMEGQKSTAKDVWLHKASQPRFLQWQGYAFENLCFKHYEAIKTALGISGVAASLSSYNYQGPKIKEGFQIDMIIDRADQVINICEIKYYNKNVVIDKAIADKLRTRRETFRELYAPKRLLVNTLITTYGLEVNEHSISQVDKVVTLDQLFSLKNF
jgi:uncharacterized protein